MSDAFIKGQEEKINRFNAALKDFVIPQEQSGLDHIPWIVFLLENRAYAISARYVLRTAVLYEIIPFMDAPAYCPGVIWDHEGMIRLLDLRALFGQGDYLSTINKKELGLPLIVVIGLDCTRRGMIVDDILMIGNFGTATDAFSDEDPAISCYINAELRCECLDTPALILNPDSLCAVEFEHNDARLNWKGYIDMGLKAGKWEK